MIMKIKNNIGVLLIVLLLGMNSCYDSKMEWGDPYTHPAAKDLPLPLQEAISRYEMLKAYAPANFKMGAGIGFNLYTTNEIFRNTVNNNFNDVTPGNEMKQASIMNSKGELNFTNVDKVVDQLSQAGLSVYGHTLVWHNQQQASYLNSLIAPQIIPAPAGSNLIANGDFENGLTGWDIPNYKEAVTVTTDEFIDGTHSMKVAVGDWGGGKYNMQINSPNFPIINGHKYEVSFFIKSTGDGQVGLDFPSGDLTNQYPWTGGKELAVTSGSWTQVKYNPTTTPDGMVAVADNASFHFRLLLGAVANMTYYIDNVQVTDLDAPAAELNYVPDGDFETGTIGSLPDGWNAANASGGISLTNEDKFSGNNSMKLVSDENTSTNYKLQLQSPTMTLDPATTYTFSFMIKSDVPGKGRISFNGKIDDGSASGNQYPYMDWTGTGSATEAFTTLAGQWEQISVKIKPFSTTLQLSFDMGYIPSVTYYLDDVKITDGTSAPSGGPTTIEKTDEEKAQIIGDAMVSWITQMVGHFKGVVHAWDAVNEPLDESGNNVKTGVGATLASDNFYWQDYLGKDYAVLAFKTAHTADPDAKLFINDYNLESNPQKLQGMIDYVAYIESQGTTVDGIGTQMHITINADTIMIDDMFKKLGATGKLIKVSELDIAIGTASPTADQFATQANMYRFIVNSYLKNIPEDKRYGITVWGVSDSPDEHTNWIPNDAPCLFDANFGRKHAYKGFADGLAGKDVSADFSGELQY